MRGIYAIVDLDTLDRAELHPAAFAEAVVEGGASALQLRAKSADGGRAASLARELGAIAKRARVPFFMNDRADIALLTGGGVHVGQTDLAPRDILALADRARTKLEIGLSTHDEAQLASALDEPIAYVAIGPVFSTLSKERPSPVLGVERARTLASLAHARRPTLPVVAIGGIGVDGAAALAGVVDAIAVIGALLPDKGASANRARATDVAKRTEMLCRAFGGGPSS